MYDLQNETASLLQSVQNSNNHVDAHENADMRVVQEALQEIAEQTSLQTDSTPVSINNNVASMGQPVSQAPKKTKSGLPLKGNVSYKKAKALLSNAIRDID